MQNPKFCRTSIIRAGPHLQTMVVTPNEKAIVFIKSHTGISLRGVHTTSKISIARIENHDGFKVVGNPSAEEDLTHHLERPDSCEVVIEERTSTNEQVRVLIGHRNGAFEIKDMKLPT